VSAYQIICLAEKKDILRLLPEIHIDIVGTHLPHNGQTVAAYLSFIAS